MIARAFLPDKRDIVVGEWHFKILAELCVALKAEDVQILVQLAEVAPERCKLSAVNVEDFDHVGVNYALYFGGELRRRRHVVRVIFHVAALLRLLWLDFDHGLGQGRLCHLLIIKCWLRVDFVEVDEHDAATSLKELLDLSQQEVRADTLLVEDVGVRLEGCFVGELNDARPNDHIVFIYCEELISFPDRHRDEFSRPLGRAFFIFTCSYDALELVSSTELRLWIQTASASLSNEESQADVLEELVDALGVVCKSCPRSFDVFTA